MSTKIPDFTESVPNVIASVLRGNIGKSVEADPVKAAVRFDTDRETRRTGSL